jgi:prolipoprotein diacylglyceryltransferase
VVGGQEKEQQHVLNALPEHSSQMMEAICIVIMIFLIVWYVDLVSGRISGLRRVHLVLLGSFWQKRAIGKM